MNEIAKQIKDTRDPKLEAEWMSNLVIDAIIKKDTSPLIHIYSYKEFNMRKKLMKNYSIYFNIIKCIIVSFLIFVSIFFCIYLLFLTGVLIANIVICTVTVTALLCTWGWFIYKSCNKCVKTHDTLIEQRNLHIKKRNAYFRV
jgi:presenilin-like A22 family membrane protease